MGVIRAALRPVVSLCQDWMLSAVALGAEPCADITSQAVCFRSYSRRSEPATRR